MRWFLPGTFGGRLWPQRSFAGLWEPEPRVWPWAFGSLPLPNEGSSAWSGLSADSLGLSWTWYLVGGCNLGRAPQTGCLEPWSKTLTGQARRARSVWCSGRNQSQSRQTQNYAQLCPSQLWGFPNLGNLAFLFWESCTTSGISRLLLFSTAKFVSQIRSKQRTVTLKHMEAKLSG